MSAFTLNPFSSATTMLRALRTRQISAVELLEMHLNRIARYNPMLNAIVTLDSDNARQAALAADTSLAEDNDRPLLGLPVTFKDSIHVQSLRSTLGVEQFADYIPDRDARITSRIRAAGAVIMGKTNIPPWADDWQTENPLFGRTTNPWNMAYTPGGSTGGGAAALSAGLTPLEFGSDFAGSIRIPAAFCGVYGHKPSETAVARTGGNPWSVLPNSVTAMAVHGPLARSADDLALALDVIAGPDVGEDAAWSVKLPPARHADLADYRVALLPSLSWLPVDEEIDGALVDLATHLRGAGVHVKEAQPEAFGDWREYYKCYLAIGAAQSSTGLSSKERKQQARELRQQGTEFGEAQAKGMEASAGEYILWFAQREQYRAAYRTFFRDWDVLLAPVNIVNAFTHMTEPWQERTLIVNGGSLPYNLQMVYPSVATLAGQPATAFPVGFTKSRLPIGLQAIGPYLEDRTPIHFVGLVTREYGGFQPPLGYDDSEAQ